MTELHIEKKERSALPWILGGLLLLALLAWFLFGRSGDRDTATVADTTATGAMAAAPATAGTTADAMPPAAAEFVRYVDARPSGGVGLDHDYTADGLRRLADALGAITERSTVSGVDVQERLTAIRSHADQLQQNPTSTEHARQAREAFLLASGLMQQMQEANYSGLQSQVREVNDAATAIRPDRQLLEQTGEVERFFERAANAVREMARPS